LAAYVDNAEGSSMRFRWVKAPTSAELTQLAHTIAQRVGRCLERQGLLERDGVLASFYLLIFRFMCASNSAISSLGLNSTSSESSL